MIKKTVTTHSYHSNATKLLNYTMSSHKVGFVIKASKTLKIHNFTSTDLLTFIF